MVGHAGRQVEHIAGAGGVFLLHGHVGQHFQGHVAAQAALFVALRAQLPVPPTGGLDQEDVVLVEMGADAAAFGGVADHDVVQAPAGHEAEIIQQQRHLSEVVVHRLHQQRPVPVTQLREALFVQRALFQVPGAVAGATDQPGLHLLLQRQPGQGIGVRVVQAAGGAGHEQGRPLPVARQEVPGRHRQVEAGQSGGGRHGIRRRRAGAYWTPRACWPALPT